MYEEFFEYLDLMDESRVYATRHVSNDEKTSVVQLVRDTIDEGKAHIVPRDKNLEFMDRYHLDEEAALRSIKAWMRPDDFVATLRDNANHGRELYLFITKVPSHKVKLFLYIKFSIKDDGSIDFISFHDNDEKKYVNYEYATDYYDNSFNEKVMKKITFVYNSHLDVNINEIERSFCEKNKITFIFKNEVDDITKSGILKSLPKDMGLKKGYISHNCYINGNLLELTIVTESFEKH